MCAIFYYTNMKEKQVLPTGSKDGKSQMNVSVLPKRGIDPKKTEGIKSIAKKKQHIKKLCIGDFCEFKITALGPKGVGIDEFSYGYPILIPNAKLGEVVKAKVKLFYPLKKTESSVLKVVENQNYSDLKSFVSLDLKKSKYAVAQMISILTPSSVGIENQNVKSNLSVGDVLTVKFNSIVPQTDSSWIGIVNYDLNDSKKFKIIIPFSLHGLAPNAPAKVDQEIKIQVTKIKLKYGFAKIFAPEKLVSESVGLNTYGKTTIPNAMQLTKGSKITLTLPKTATKYAKHIVILLSSRNTLQKEDSVPNALLKEKPDPLRDVFFIKNVLGAKLGDKVRVKLTKLGSTFAIGKIVRIAPNSALKKLARARKSVNEMLANGMHYGEKVVKCQAKMRNYIWNRKKGPRSGPKYLISSPLSFGMKQRGPSIAGDRGPRGPILLGNRVGANFLGQRSSPYLKKMTLSPKKIGHRGPSITGNRSPLIKKGRHLINLLKSRRCLNISLNQLTKYAAKGRTFLFVGTKKPAAGLIARAALFTKTSFFVNTRWLGGMLTNWKTIIKSISKIRPILKEKQKVIKSILEKRAKIQKRLMKKVLSLRKKSQVLILKGQQLIEKVKNFADTNSEGGQKNKLNGINIKRKQLFERGQFLLKKRQNLLNKQNILKEKTFSIKENGFLIANKYKVLFNKLTTTHKKLHDLRLLFILNKELRNIKQLAKKQGKNQYTLSYVKAQALKQLTSGNNQHGEMHGVNSKKLLLIPNPPQEILNNILITINEISNLGSQNKFSSNTSIKSLQGKAPFNSKSGKEKNGESSIVKSIVLTKLLSKFSRFLPYIKNAISSLLRIILSMEKKMTELKIHLKMLKTKLIDFMAFNNKINAELKLIQTKYTSEQQIIRVLRRKLKRRSAEKKLLQFLPKLHYLPTPKSDISVAIQILMKRFVDPKLKYPMDLIYDEKLRKKSKKVAAKKKKQWQRLETYFGGISNMTKLKKAQISNNVAIIIGQQEEMNAVRECKKLGIKMFHIVDTNCNPGLADHFIPSNDQSRNSVKYILNKIVTRIRLAKQIRSGILPTPASKL